ncbi:MAG: hypothetical protein CSB48_02735 [Proteobacteria bacterium]|nr:MAG: hypothetical protein CSB48_02735 [Pseudomonadota bacterium]
MRKSPRYLCSEGFGSCVLTIGKQVLELESINYSHDGIALFNIHPFPDCKEFTISFSYKADNEEIRIEQLPCLLIHMRDTESGELLGAAFRLEQATTAQLNDLIRIEEHISGKSAE